MSKKIIFCDVDGTLISYDSPIPPTSEYEAFKKARENGHKIFLVTGRTLAHIEEPIMSLGVDGVIGGNGAFTTVGNEIISSKTMSADTTAKIVDYLYKHNHEFFVEAVNGIYGSKDFRVAGLDVMKKYGKSDVTDMMDLYPNMTFPTDWHIGEVTKFNYILNTYDDYLRTKEDFKDYKNMTWGGQGEEALYGDIAQPNIDKAVAIKNLIDYLGVSLDDTIAFGDAEVDIPMFEACGHSVCVGNGRLAAKEAAEYVTDEVSQDGIYNAFKHFNLI